ncbi:MAG: 3-mercaptopyruvate sulfurtransferase [Rhizobiaceae bacterium]
MSTSPFTVDTDWLFAHLDDPNLSVVDASWYLPTMLVNGQPRDGKAEYDVQHIPGAVYFDIDDVVDPKSTLPHTLASPELFAQKAGALGISDEDTIVVYDGMGLFSAARVWWNFRIMGASKVVLLNGGLPRWIADRLPIEAGQSPVYPKLFKANYSPDAVASFDDMQAFVADGSRQIADARPAARFTGEAPEPRARMRSGHMPGANSVPMTELTAEGALLSADGLKAVFAKAGVDLQSPVVTSCGSGVTAAVLSLALDTIGHSDHKLYDGSWSQWGGRDDTPVETG